VSQENVETMRRAVEEFLAGTSEHHRGAMLTKLAEVWDPRIELDASEAPVLDLAGAYRGRDAVVRFWQEWLAAWETMRFDYEMVDAGDCVVQLLDLRMRGRSTGIEVPFGKCAWVYALKNGLVIHQKFYMDQAQALKAVGLEE
jgi:ketosteroid isomerase-like protein